MRNIVPFYDDCIFYTSVSFDSHILSNDSLNQTQFASLSGKDTDGRGRLISIADWVDNSEDFKTRRSFLITTAGLHISVFNIGYIHERGTFNSYILQLPNGDFSIYKPRQWNHICYAWSSGGRSKILLVY